MKKILITLSILLVLCGCQKKENIEKFYLNDNDSFLLFTYNYYCSLAIPCDEIFKSFSENENIEILSMSIDEFKKTSYYKTVKYAPSVLIIRDGKIVTYLDAEKNSDIEKYQDVEKFTEWVEKYIYFNK